MHEVMTTPNQARWLHDPYRIWSVWLPLIAALAFWMADALYGFNPTDDGFVLSQAWRIAGFETPHVDFTSPRPLGSAILHAPESLVPLGTLALSRLIVVMQLLWIAVGSVRILTDRLLPLRGAQGFALVVLAFVLNVSTWPIMAWHTVDGLFLGVTAMWLSQRSSNSRASGTAKWVAVWLAAGFAPLVKQGFAVVPFLILATVVLRRQWRGLAVLPVALGPTIVYAIMTRTTPGGLTEQLYSGSTDELLKPARDFVEWLSADGNWRVTLVALCAGAAAIAARRYRPLIIGVPLLAAVPVLWAAHADAVALGGSWPWSAVAVLMVSVLFMLDRLRDIVEALFLLALAYAASLSWGVTTPGLLAGSMLAAAIVLLALRAVGSEEKPTPFGTGFSLAVTAVALVACCLVLPARAQSPYRDVHRGAMTETVGVPAFAGIRLSPQVAAYVTQIEQCLANYPAHTVAMLPDGAGFYPLFRVRSPFHNDWWSAAERSPDHNARIDDAVESLEGSSGWLVLFHSFDLAALPSMSSEQAVVPGPPFAYVAGDQAVLDQLHGERVQCGAMSGVYRPPSAE